MCEPGKLCARPLLYMSLFFLLHSASIFFPPLRKFGQEPYESLGITIYIILVETKVIIFRNMEPT